MHHDQLMEPTELPTFNSFGIVTHLHELAGLSERFLYVEDDMLFGARTGLSDFVAADGRVKLYPKLMATPSGATHHRPRWSPWNNALAQSNALLDLHYAKTRRPFIAHAPLLIDKASFARFIAAFPEAVQTTRRSRFRGPGNIAPEHMYPYYLWHEGLATLLPRRQRFRNLGYAGLSSNLPLTAGQLALLRWSRPKFCCLNDNFEAHPNPRAVRLTREFLERSHPTRSEFERHVSGT